MDIEKAIEELKYVRQFFHVDEESLDLAIKILENQIAKIITRKDISESYKCPSCNEDRSWKDGRCCKNCGQLLDWRND
ncbi:hypothetical protein DW1_1145 [Proteiniborus sp. DW1]|uniref:hypothetical protein n=1 Tax=Proteiniborus sp. DW1 TaxID=1889883 RepID=UPI00092E0493|nr:hypothetical protein [Proteiniborus sp. DW1]SCG82718.1 hypothetical protein DW1_1145 [Proteiniborus sp. DW1]